MMMMPGAKGQKALSCLHDKAFELGTKIPFDPQNTEK